MASTVFELSLRVTVFTLTIASGTFPVCADQESCNAATTCKVGKEKSIVKTTVTTSPYFESEEDDYSEYEVDVRNKVEINCLDNEMATATSGPGSSSAEETVECELVGDEQLSVETAMAAAVLAVRHSCPSLRQAAITFIRARMVLVMRTREWADARRYHPEDFIEVYRLLAEVPPETSTPAPADSQPSTKAESQHHSGQTPASTAPEVRPTTIAQTQPHSDHSQTPASAAPELRPTTEAQSQPRSDHSQTSTSAAPEVWPTTEAQSQTRSDHSQTPTLAAPDVRPTTEAQSQPRSDHSQTPAALPTPPHRSTPPDDDLVSQFRRLSAEEKGRQLIGAAREGSVEKMQALLAAGADVGVKDANANTILHLAAFRGDMEVVKVLLEGGADSGARNIMQATPLHYAARWGHAAVVRLLAASSAETNARDWLGWTPLHYAARWGQPEAVAALLVAGADRWVTTNDGGTPLDLARANNQQQIIDMLK